MKFHVYRLRRDGQERMRHSWGEDKFCGHLVVKEEQHPDLHRICKTAKLVDDFGQPLEGLPPLLDAVLVTVRMGYWSMNGFERFENGNRFTDYAQSWMLVPEDEAAD